MKIMTSRELVNNSMHCGEKNNHAQGVSRNMSSSLVPQSAVLEA